MLSVPERAALDALEAERAAARPHESLPGGWEVFASGEPGDGTAWAGAITRRQWILRRKEEPITSHALARLAPTANSRELEILRLLGRLEVVPTRSIAPLCFPDVSQRHVQRQMQELYERKLVWREMTTIDRVEPPETGRARRVQPPKAPFIYGLTPEGQALLEWSEIEPTEDTYTAFRTRPWRDPDLSDAKLTHDLLGSV